MSFPLRYAKGNVLLGRGGEAAGLYRLAMTSYPFLPTGEKWALQRRLQRLAHTISADFSLWRVNRAYPAERYVAAHRRAAGRAPPGPAGVADVSGGPPGAAA